MNNFKSPAVKNKTQNNDLFQLVSSNTLLGGNLDKKTVDKENQHPENNSEILKKETEKTRSDEYYSDEGGGNKLEPEIFKKSQRERRASAWINDDEVRLTSDCINDKSVTYQEALKKCDNEKWKEAVEAELKLLKDTWTKINESEARDILNSK